MKIWAIAITTFWELVRDKVLYNLVAFSVLLLLFGFLASRLSFVRPERVMLDFGLTAVTWVSAFLALLTSASQLPREVERRTISLALSRPVTRVQFILGKFLGLTLILALNAVALDLVLVLILSLTGGGLPAVWSATLFWAFVFVVIQSAWLVAVTFLFSAWSTATLSVIFGLGMYLVGSNVSQIRFIAAKIQNPLMSRLVETIALFLPQFEACQLGGLVTYQLPVGAGQIVGTVLYAMIWSFAAILLASVLLRTRESG